MIFYQLVKFLNGEISAAMGPANQRKKLKPIAKNELLRLWAVNCQPLFPPQTLYFATSATSVLLT
ncbi:hypothetical protein [Phaeobacter italicus]|uniref:hypothetical protein n=1 Tax=Phaeobacter italicus TaxID=481446 RepID=UPI00232B7E18|nr:hypothetical protein [Phaeobacter italicus]